jgi:anti-anti-sigma factor
MSSRASRHVVSAVLPSRTGGGSTLVVRCVIGNGLTVVTVIGDVSVDTAPRLRTVLKAAVDSGRPVLVGMVAVGFIDRVGSAVLAAAHRRAQDAGTSLLLQAAPAQMPPLIALLDIDPAAASIPADATGFGRSRRRRSPGAPGADSGWGTRWRVTSLPARRARAS